jgi:1-acyl-sn-glycerol-3-phosphate acyltransferase
LNRSLPRRIWVTLSTYVIGCYASLINNLRIEGAEHLPRRGGVLIAANHISGYETVLLPWAVCRHQPLQMVWAPAKEELFRNRLLGALFRSWGAFPVKRRRDVRAGKVLEDLLRTDKVMLYPEGTRHPDGKLGRGNRGVGKLIYTVRPVVVPTAITGLNQWKFPGFRQPAAITFGAPLDFSDLFEREDNKETQQQIVDRLMAAIAALLGQEPPA